MITLEQALKLATENLEAAKEEKRKSEYALFEAEGRVKCFTLAVDTIKWQIEESKKDR